MKTPSDDTLPHDLTNKVIGDYRVIRRLGRGGMADVYLAEQLSLKRNVALKVLKAELAKDQSYLKRFRREAQAAAALVQANIVQIYEVGREQEIHFIAQEYVPGRNLGQFLTRFGAVEPLMALNVLRQTTLALQKAHENGVIHRDIKPENIMLSTTGEIKVTDFGLARINDNPGDSQHGLTQIGITMGTPLYMSPEQAEGRHLDTRSDIYSLGATLYHMLAGKPPFEGENPIAIAVKQVNENPESLTTIRPDIPEELSQLVHEMLAKKPDDRPSNPSELLLRIRKIKVREDEDWASLAEKLIHDDTLSIPSTTDAKLAVTRQLQNVMLGREEPWWNRTAMMMVVGLAVLASTLGAVLALSNPPNNLLDESTINAISAKVERQASAKQQYQAAYWSDGDPELHWQAVIEYFPLDNVAPGQQSQTEFYHNLAKERLAEVYLERMDLEKAKSIYDEFVNTEDISERINLNGHAGYAIIFHLQDEPAKCRESLNRVENHLDQISPFLRNRIEQLPGQLGKTNNGRTTPST